MKSEGATLECLYRIVSKKIAIATPEKSLRRSEAIADLAGDRMSTSVVKRPPKRMWTSGLQGELFDEDEDD
ncbi:MAG: hypothetical protein ACI8UO_005574 [Verrucomicrobiales bacterium]